MKLADGRDILARLARGDVEIPDFDGFPIDAQTAEVRFEAAVYELLASFPQILCTTASLYSTPRHGLLCLSRILLDAGYSYLREQKARTTCGRFLTRIRKYGTFSQCSNSC